MHTPRLDERIINLETCFDLGVMKIAWQKYVKLGLRNQDILDLHDYYDFHRNRNEILKIIRNQILEGNYKPKPPHVIRTEKKYGVCRHLLIPTPEDGIVLQTLVENLSSIIKAAQPTTRAYYSRSHGVPKSEKDIDDTFPYPWWELWPEFQERIYEFGSTFDYIVVSDIANYYDNISFKQLRNILTSFGTFDEGLLDFLFYMLEAMVWRPDYLPLSGVGLPQINFDAPRLLAHGLLFEIDRFLNNTTTGNFVRWMDDIDFGVNDKHKAKKILRGLDELLLTRGLRLNLGKTQILSKTEAYDYFLPNENRFLSVYTKRIKRKLSIGDDITCDNKKISGRFRKFLKYPKVGRWEKVYGRYFSLCSITRDPFLEKYVPTLLKESPGLRQVILRYYTKLGANSKRLFQLIDFYKSKDCADDSIIFTIAKSLTDWKISPKSKLRKEIVQLALSPVDNSSSNFIASIWLLSKYGSEQELADFILKNTETWKYSSFMSRQIAAASPRLRNLPGQHRLLKSTLIETGQLDALRIIHNLDNIRDSQPLSAAERLYILHGTKPVEIYPLPKFLIAVDLLTNQGVFKKIRRQLRKELIERISDPIYLKEIESIKI